MKHAPWLIVGLVLIGAWWSVAGARDAALREQGRVEELTRLREIAEDEAEIGSANRMQNPRNASGHPSGNRK